MSATSAEREFEFTQQDFKTLGDLVTKHAGIIVMPEKFDMFYSRLARRVRALNLANFKQYCELLTSAGNQDEFHNFINAITTNLTSFFRENHHFEYLSNHIIPELIKRNARSSRLRIWSAGCSTGEEPYTLAITVKEALAHHNWDIKILATDIDSNVLETAKSGLYKEDRISGLSAERKSKWFKKGKGANEGMVAVSQELKDLISFKRLNLMDDTWPMKGPFDVIFCRNVVIYFDRETKEKLVDRYTNLLTDDGHLLIGHSESLHKANTRLKLLGNTIYQKI